MSVDPEVPEGFPDLFVYALKDVLVAELTNDPDFPADNVQTRPLRPTDPNMSVGVVEGEAMPDRYEIAGRLDPTATKWQVVVQVLAKSAEEIDGRNIRKRLMTRVRKALFLESTAASLATLADDYERVIRYRLQRLDFVPGVRDAKKSQFLFLGQVELDFTTEVVT